MKNRTKRFTTLVALSLCAALLGGLFAACDKTKKGGKAGESTSQSTVPIAAAGELTVRVYAPDTAQKALWQALAADYKAVTGVNLALTETPETPAVEHLKEALGRAEAPSVFLFTNPSEYAAWKDHAADLTNSEAFKRLLDPKLALTAEGKPVAVPLGVHAFGIIYNKKIMNAYFSLASKATSYTKPEEINDFSKLNALVKDMTENKKALGIDGVFAAPTLKEGEDSALSHRLLSLPLSYEFQTGKAEWTGAGVNKITFKYAEAYKKLLDMMLTNTTAAAEAFTNRAEEAAIGELATGKAAMLLGGTELWGKLNTAAAGTLTTADIGMLPAQLQFSESEKSSLALEPQCYAAINTKASAEEQAAAAAFLEWLVSSEKGLDFIATRLNWLAPFSTVTETSLPANPLCTDTFTQLKAGDATAIHLVSAAALSPGAEFRDKTVAAGLVAYAKGEAAWDDFTASVKDKWKEAREKIAEAIK
ncbi:MAG: extracellular solute-binding protein [Oscillospiraceae bacterium]|jgi:raffinose/stachyose/melibiose transport system substrate-binding protein|nr:extracellular solute-binding protein [Oscillospiraceae bacterium]